MRPIDEYIVRMQLENEQFKRNAKETVGIFESMKAMFGRQDSVGALDSMAVGMETLVSKFDVGSVMIRRVLDNIVDHAMQAGRRMAQAITNPLVEAGKRRALTIEQAQFQFKGLGMNVEDTMASANEAVLGTAFGLDEAAMAAAMFGASGMEAGDEMTTALRAISGVAAMAGSSFGDISNVFTSVAGNGRVMGNDLLRLSTRGVNAAATMADYYTELGDGAEVTEAQVRKMVTEGKVSFEDFAAAMDGAFGEHATKSSETYAGALSLVNSAIQRIGATMFAQGFEDKKNIFNAMQPQINNLHEALKPLIHSFNDWKTIVSGRFATRVEQMNLRPLTKSIKDFVDLGGMDNITGSFENMGSIANVVLSSVKKSLNNTFNKPSVESVVGMFKSIESGFESIKDTFVRNSHNITSAFDGLFAIMELGWHMAKQLLGIFMEIPPAGLGDGIFEVAGNLGEMAVAFAGAVKEGDLLPAVMTAISGGISTAGGIISSVFGGMSKIFEGFLPTLKAVWSVMKEIASFSAGLIGDIFSGFTGADVLNVAAAGGIIAMVKKIGGFLDKSLDKFSGFIKESKKTADRVTGLLDSVTESLTAMASHVKAKTLLTIAAAVGVLAVSLKLLETLSIGDIAKGLSAITGSLTAIWLAFLGLNRIDMGGLKMTKTVGTLIGISAAVSILAGAIKKMADLDPDRINTSIRAMIGIMVAMTVNMTALSKIKGLEVGAMKMIGISIALRILVTAIKPLSKIDTHGLINGITSLGLIMLELALFSKLISKNPISIPGAIGTTIMAGALLVMSKAVGSLGALDTNSLVKGISGLGVILLEIALFSKMIKPKGIVKTSVAMTIMSVALKEITKSVGSLGNMSMESLAKGLGALGVVMLELSLFYKFMPSENILRISTAMVILAKSISMLVPPLVELGGMSKEALIKSLGGLAVVLTELILAMKFASGGIAGALALVILSSSLKGLTEVLKELSKIEPKALATAIIGLGVALGVLGAAGMLLAPAVPGMLGMAAALLLFAGAVALMGVGIELLGSGMETFSKVSTLALENFIAGMGMMLDSAVENVPKVGQLFVELVVVIVESLADAVPRLVRAGLELVLGVLQGIADGFGELIDIGVQIVMTLIEGITEHAPDLIMAGFDLIVSLVSGMADALEENGEVLVSEFMRLFGEILILVIEAGTQVISALFGWIPGVEGAMDWVGTSATEAIREAFTAGDVGSQKGDEFSNAVSDTSGAAYKAGANIGDEANRGAASPDFAHVGGVHGTDYTGGISSKEWSAFKAGAAIGENAKSGAGSLSLYGTGENVGYGFSSGMTGRGVMSSLWSAGVSLFNRAKSAVQSAAGIQSPATKMIEDGEYFTEGFAIGISKNEYMAEAAGSDMIEKAMGTIRDKASLIANILESELNISPRVTPVLDLGGFDTSELDDMFERYANETNRRTNNRYGSIEYANNQNGNNLHTDSRTNGPQGPNIEYHAHLEVHGALPKSTIDRMARDLDNAIKKMDDRKRIGRGEDVGF